VLDAEGAETGMFEIPAGGRRYRALQLLVKQKRLAKTASVCMSLPLRRPWRRN
jgi:ParB family chromosome partitioning protein